MTMNVPASVRALQQMIEPSSSNYGVKMSAGARQVRREAFAGKLRTETLKALADAVDQGRITQERADAIAEDQAATWVGKYSNRSSLQADTSQPLTAEQYFTRFRARRG